MVPGSMNWKEEGHQGGFEKAFKRRDYPEQDEGD